MTLSTGGVIAILSTELTKVLACEMIEDPGTRYTSFVSGGLQHIASCAFFGLSQVNSSIKDSNGRPRSIWPSSSYRIELSVSRTKIDKANNSSLMSVFRG